MELDEEAFLYPHIDEKKCINCGMCNKACPILAKRTPNFKGKAYACINQDDEVRLRSSSGGMFSLLAEAIIKQGGIVFGPAFDENFNVHHIEIADLNDIVLLRGSKYMQSRIENTYIKAKEYLDGGKMVLFSGTPCQINGIMSFLGKNYDNLITQDLICHGVPSTKAWQSYLNYQKDKFGADISHEKSPSFRLKAGDYKNYSMAIYFDNNQEYRQTADKDLFMKAFLTNLCLRPSCYNCKSKSLERESDITLADFWGIENVAPDMDDNKGTSLVFINSDKGNKLFEIIKDYLRYCEVDIDNAAAYNQAAYCSALMPEKRNKFMHMIDNMSFDKALTNCLKRNIFKRIFGRIKRIVLRRI
jgi:coenzyme F420-reducing hydrogenase beta subunit